MIKIGANEKIYLSLVEKQTNEETKQFSLAVGFSELGTEVATKSNNPLDLLNDSSDTSGESNVTKVVLFPPSVVYLSDDSRNDKWKKDDPRPGKEVFDDFLTLKNMCSHILKRFMTDKEIKFDLLKGINVAGKSAEQIVQAFAKPEVRDHVFNNLIQQFTAMAEKFIGDQTKISRLFLVRTSMNNHFGTLRRKYLDRNPFFEDGTIGIKESNMYTEKKKGTTGLHEPIEIDGRQFVPNFSAYEIQKGLDSGAPIAADGEETEDAAISMDNAEAGLSPSLFTVGDEGTDSTEEGTEGLNL